jgi:hypothetical protein
MDSKLDQGVIVAHGNSFLEPSDGFSHPPTFSVHYCDIVWCTGVSATKCFFYPLECFVSIPPEDFSFIEQQSKIVLSRRATMFGRSPKPFQSSTR